MIAEARSAQVRGTVRNLTFFNPDTGYFVARVEVDGKKDTTTVTGFSPTIHEGEFMVADGTFEKSNYGLQLKANRVDLSPPTEIAGLKRYLVNSIKGIGAGYADKLVAAFGTDVFRIAESDPAQLTTVLGPKRGQIAVDALKGQGGDRDVYKFLYTCGLTPLKAKNIVKRYKDKTESLIRENPYRLCKDVNGFGFLRADQVAKSLGIDERSPFRLSAALEHALAEAEGQGSCGLPSAQLIDKAVETTGVERQLLLDALDYSLQHEQLLEASADGVVCVFRSAIAGTERFIAKSILARLVRHKEQPASREIDDLITSAEKLHGKTLNEEQRAAVRLALTSPVSVITGGPGTGKTTVTQILLTVAEHLGLQCRLAAPTGKAAKRATEATGEPCPTLHRLLESKGQAFARNRENPLELNLLGIDEFSMVDIWLSAAVIDALPFDSRLVLIGDEDQLPSVGAGRVLADLLASGRVPYVRLTEVRRQALGSPIIRAAYRVNSGKLPYADPADDRFRWIMYERPKSKEDAAEQRHRMAQQLIATVRDSWKLGLDPIRDVQVLAPMRSSLLGYGYLNTALQKVLNPRPSARLVLRDDYYLAVGDKVMQIKNNYDRNVFNGDTGFIASINEAKGTVVVEFDSITTEYKKSELDEIVLAFAYSIHKSQGSEFPMVVMPVDYCHWVMLKRNLVFTGMTRARDRLVVIGTREAMIEAVRRLDLDSRHSQLKDLLLTPGNSVPLSRSSPTIH